MKHILSCILLLIAVSASAAIVDNSTNSPTGEDSLSVLFYSLDSLGNPVAADSVYLLVIGPSGAVVRKDSMTISDSRITATTIRDKQFYSFADQISNIDGAGVVGNYALTILAKKNSPNLLTPNIHSFQLIEEGFADQVSQIGDSVFVQGGIIDSNKTELGGGIDSTSLVRWVWNTPHANHTTGATFGDYLDAEISGLTTGGGAYSVSIQVYDSTIDQSVGGVEVAVRNASQTAVIAHAYTNSEGLASFNLNSAAYVVVASSPGYLFDTFDTIQVAGTQTDTVFATQFAPGAPSSASLCRVYGHLHDLQGEPEEDASVMASLPSGVALSGDLIISPAAVSTQTDSTGYFFIDLIPSDSLIVDDTQYELSITRRDGTVLIRRMSVPDSSSWRLTW